MFLVSFPSAMIVILLIYIFTLPHFYSDYVNSKISTTNNYYGFDMFDNQTNTINRPISSMYASTYKALGFSFGISRVAFHHEIFFNQMQIVLYEKDGSAPLQQLPEVTVKVVLEDQTTKSHSIEVFPNGTFHLKDLGVTLGLPSPNACKIPSTIQFTIAFPKGAPQEQLFVSLRNTFPQLV